MLKKILITGITGNIGAYTAGQLLKKGHTVVAIARSRSKMVEDAFLKKTLKSLSQFSGDETMVDEALKEGRLVVLKGDISDPASIAALELPFSIDETWHFASSLKYMPKDNEEITEANITGVKNILSLHDRFRSAEARFVYISTAYIGGKNMHVVPEAVIDMDERLSFNNEYERTKLLAENIVREFSEQKDMGYCIFRPSIVIGEKFTGRLVNYNGFYLGLKAFHTLNEYLAKPDGTKTRLRFESNPDNTLNLIPIDDVDALMQKIIETNPPSGSVFNITNGTETRIGDILNIINSSLSNLEIQISSKEAFMAEPRNRNEKMLAYGFNYVLPYLNQDIQFTTDSVVSQTGSGYALALIPDHLRFYINHYLKRLSRKTEASGVVQS